MTENIEVFTQSSIRIKDGNRTIYFDPYQMREEPKDADYILITHDHYDHFSPEDIAKVSGSNTVLIVPERMADTANQVSN
jgi:L-ascorbate metabolism protein UlaG (beta-lactamase superfamily)